MSVSNASSSVAAAATLLSQPLLLNGVRASEVAKLERSLQMTLSDALKNTLGHRLDLIFSRNHPPHMALWHAAQHSGISITMWMYYITGTVTYRVHITDFSVRILYNGNATEVWTVPRVHYTSRNTEPRPENANAPDIRPTPQARSITDGWGDSYQRTFAQSNAGPSSMLLNTPPNVGPIHTARTPLYPSDPAWGTEGMTGPSVPNDTSYWRAIDFDEETRDTNLMFADIERVRQSANSLPADYSSLDS